jgi:hypothetical protein
MSKKKDIKICLPKLEGKEKEALKAFLKRVSSGLRFYLAIF